MLIGELAKHSGLSKDTIRWYEKIGLLSGTHKARDANNYRNYGNEILEKLILIRQSKSFGFSLKEIRELLGLIESDSLNCEAVRPIIDTKLRVIDQKITELQNIRTKLVTLNERCTGNCEEQIAQHA